MDRLQLTPEAEPAVEAMLLRQICDPPQNPAPLVPAVGHRPVGGLGVGLGGVWVGGVGPPALDDSAGRPPPPRLPVIPGHQIVGRVAELGDGVEDLRRGERVGIAWIHSACGHCRYCHSGRENLCADFVATGRDVDGGYAAFARVPAAFAHPLPEELDDASVAPLLCAGAIGYRSLDRNKV